MSTKSSEKDLLEQAASQHEVVVIMNRLDKLEANLLKLMEELHHQHMVALHGSGYMRRK